MITSTKFLWYNRKQIKNFSELEITVAASMDKFGHSVPNGMYDLRMGPCERDQTCETCQLNILHCPGHFGYMNINTVINPLTYSTVVSLLKSCCEKCHRFKMSNTEKMNGYLALESASSKLVSKHNTVETYEELEHLINSAEPRESIRMTDHAEAVADILKRCSIRTKCPLCFHQSRKLTRGNQMRILIDDPVDGPTIMPIGDMVKDIEQLYENERVILNKMYSITNNEETKNENDTSTNNKPDNNKSDNGSVHPMHWLFLDCLPIIPNKFRPPKKRDGNVYEHVMNTSLNQILNYHNLSQINDKYIPELQAQVLNYYDNVKNQGIKQLLEKKSGLFRQNIQGKRVNYSARSVISPDPCIGTGEIGVPLVFAQKLTFPERVNRYNVDRIKTLVVNGSGFYPGANFIDMGGKTISLKHLTRGKRAAISTQLSNDDVLSGNTVVHRHLVSGDRLLVNRQPTLHKPSMMGHIARVL